jgi:hypothetical protein
LSAAASSLESAARTHAANEINALVLQLTENLRVVNAQLRKAS